MDNLPPAPPPGYHRVEVPIPDRFTVVLGAVSILGDPYVEKWLNTPNPALAGRVPTEVLDSPVAGDRLPVAQVLVDLHHAGADAVAAERARLDAA